jgi:hypothetical protein
VDKSGTISISPDDSGEIGPDAIPSVKELYQQSLQGQAPPQ